MILRNIASNTCHPAPVKHVTITSYPAADRISAREFRPYRVQRDQRAMRDACLVTDNGKGND